MSEETKNDGINSSMDRRRFMSTTAAAASIGLAGNVFSQDSEVKNKDDINIAICGIGAQGKVQMNSLLKIPGVRFKAVVDIYDRNRIYGQRYLNKFKHQTNAYEDHKEMLEVEKDIDAVFVATPDFMHAPITCDSLKAGKHVYCEKMMSNTIEAAAEMVRTRDATGKLLQIGHQRRSNPRYRHVKDKLLGEAKLLGPQINYANAQWNRGLKEDIPVNEKYAMDQAKLEKFGYANMSEFLNWRVYKKYGGGAISDLGAHQIDILNWFYDATPKRILASCGNDQYKHHEHFDTNMVIYEYDLPSGETGRAFYQVLTTTSSLGFMERFMGLEGTLAFSENPRWNTAYREVSAPEWSQWKEKGYISKPEDESAEEEDVVVDVRQSPQPEAWDVPVELNKPIHMPHLENFIGAVRDGTPLNCPAEVGFSTCVSVLKIEEAVKKGNGIYNFKPEDFKI